MAQYDFSVFTNVELIGADLSDMNDEQLEVLFRQARYCQAMTDADTKTLRELASITFTSVLNANVYGARGTYRMNGTHWFEKRNGNWISINAPNR